MDTFLLSIKMLEQKVVDHLLIYKRCQNEEERIEVRGIIHGLELSLHILRNTAARENAKETFGGGER